MSYLSTIIAHKADELADTKRRAPVDALRAREGYQDPRRPFADALQAGRPFIIAEIKFASPSKGRIRTGQDVLPVSRSYAAAGATALSVLTDERFFNGHISFLPLARTGHHLPVLRKDFIVDPYQLHEARAYGADAVLLIVAALGKERLIDLKAEADELGLESLIEVHTEEDLAALQDLHTPVVGINNRDLDSFETRLDVSFRLRPHVPPGVLVVSESGIRTGEDLRMLWARGIDGALIGETLMRHDDPGQALRDLLQQAKEATG